jgi:hypothetical protein
MDKQRVQDFVDGILTILGMSVGVFLMYVVLNFAWVILKSLYQIIF